MDAWHACMIALRDNVHNGSAIGKALDYSLKRWTALSRHLDDGAVLIDNNWRAPPKKAEGTASKLVKTTDK